MSMNPLDLRFPLDDDALPRLLVDKSTITGWTRAAQAEIANVLHERASWYFRSDELSRSFKLIHDKEPLRGFTRSGSNADKKDFLCQARVHLSLDDIAYGLYSETTFEQRSVNVQLYQEAFLDGAVLHVAEKQTQEDPFHFAGVKWAALSSQSAGLGAPRDFVYFEYSCKTVDADGRPVLVQYVECPELLRHQIQEHDMGLTRGSMLMINTFRTDVDGSTYVQSAGTFEIGKSMGSWASGKTLPLPFRSVVNLVGLADARAIVNLGVLKTLPARQDDSEKKTCCVCAKKFNLLTRSRQSCRACGRCTCRKCTIGLKFFNENSLYSSTLPVVSEKFCFKCVMVSREQRLNSNGLESVVSLSMASSGMTVSSATSAASGSTAGSFCVDDSVEMARLVADRLENLGLSRPQHDDTQSMSSQSDCSEPESILGVTVIGGKKPSQNKPKSVSLLDEDASTQMRRAAKSSVASPVAPTASTAAARSKSVFAPSASVNFSASSAAGTGATGTGAAVPGGGGAVDAFTKMSEAIAAQNALLMNIQHERQKMQSSQAGGFSGYAQYTSSASSPLPRSPVGVVASEFTTDDDRFEIIE